jgi:hypothetical protein|tara:strand:+ start:2627 stop:3052 length:426 start_codon:yes stop_codon:yes gene_type:complete
MGQLFQEKDFVGHSGENLHWKIEMDALSYTEWQCIARMILPYTEHTPFREVLGIPRGGKILADILQKSSTGNPSDPYLVVDDVLTTGGSMEEFRNTHSKILGNDCLGWVVFARIQPPSWVTALFQMPKKWADNPNSPEYYD